MAQGYGFRNQVTSPENNQDIYSGGKVVGGSAGITDPRGRSLSLDYDRNRPIISIVFLTIKLVC